MKEEMESQDPNSNSKHAGWIPFVLVFGGLIVLLIVIKLIMSFI